MKKKVLIISVCSLLVLAWLVRIITLNTSIKRENIAVYEMGSLVEYNKDYFVKSSEQRDGYKILVKSAKIEKYEDFAAEQGLTLPEKSADDSSHKKFRADYVFDVEATIYNVDNTNENGGIDMFNTILVSSNTRFRIDDTLWSLLYPQLGSSYTFKLRPNTQMDFHFPFVVETSDEQKIIDLSFLKTRQFYLDISQYPTKKMIRIKL